MRRTLMSVLVVLAVLLPMNVTAQTPFTIASQNVIDSKGEITPTMWTAEVGSGTSPKATVRS
jgi:hypothetical protein